MKILKYASLGFAGILLAAVAILYILASREDANKMTVSVEIDKSPAELWPWLEEPEKIKQWVGWVIEIKPLTPGKQGVGAKAHWVMEDRNNDGARVEMDNEVIEYVPLKKIVTRVAASESFTGESSFVVEDLGGKSRLTSTGRYDFGSPFVKLLTTLIMSSAGDKLKEDMMRLKGLVEKR